MGKDQVKDSFLFHFDDLEVLEDMSAEETGWVFQAIIQYAKDGTAPEIEDRFMKHAFKALARRHDADTAKYQEKCRKNSENISKRWNTTVYDRTDSYNEEIPTDTKNTDMDMELDMELDMDTDMDKDTDKKKAAKRPTRHKFGEYSHVRLSDAEYEKLIHDYGEPQTAAAIRKVDEYCERSGKTYKNYYLTLRNWGYEGIGPPQKDDVNTELRNKMFKEINERF